MIRECAGSELQVIWESHTRFILLGEFRVIALIGLDVLGILNGSHCSAGSSGREVGVESNPDSLRSGKAVFGVEVLESFGCDRHQERPDHRRKAERSRACYLTYL
jgi:hypothetical protein